MILAGLPATIAPAGTSFVTTLPAPIIAFSPIVIPQSNVAPEPMEAPRLTSVPNAFPVGFRLQLAAAVGGRGITIIGESDIVTDENLVFQSYPFTNEGVAGDFAAVSNFNPFLNLHERSNLYVIPDLTTVKIDEIVKPDISAQLHVRSHPLKRMLRRTHLIQPAAHAPEILPAISDPSGGEGF